jgi:hypothetical protein
MSPGGDAWQKDYDVDVSRNHHLCPRYFFHPLLPAHLSAVSPRCPSRPHRASCSSVHDPISPPVHPLHQSLLTRSRQTPASRLGDYAATPGTDRSPAGGYSEYNAGSYSQPTPGYSQPTPGYNQGTPGYNQGTPGYNQGTPGYNQGTPGYNQGTPGYNHPTPGYNQGTPGYNQPTPGFTPGFTPGYNQPTPGGGLSLLFRFLFSFRRILSSCQTSERRPLDHRVRHSFSFSSFSLYLSLPHVLMLGSLLPDFWVVPDIFVITPDGSEVPLSFLHSFPSLLPLSPSPLYSLFVATFLKKIFSLMCHDFLSFGPSLLKLRPFPPFPFLPLPSHSFPSLPIPSPPSLLGA